VIQSLKVVFFHRKRISGFYSMENLFEQVRCALPKNISHSMKELRFHSTGFFKRLYISIEAACNQGDVNHITGDVHFIALFMKRRNTVLTIHDLGFMNQANSAKRTLLKWFWVILPVKRSAVVTVVSVETKTELLKYISKKYESRIKVIYNPLTKGFEPNQKAFNKIEPTILQIGTTMNKNLSRLIQALSTIRCKIEIVGNLPEVIVQELIEHKIKYNAFKNLSHTEILDKYQSADIVAFVSTLEGFGLPIIEGNAIGRVVVTSNISSMPEIARDAAQFANPYEVTSIRDAFLKVINDEDYRENLILNGFQNVKRFERTEIAMQYASVYQSLIG
jgi:glycosyltransferase involved in cell wall biosynthesis